MSQEILNILLSALGVIITGLATFLVTKLTAWIETKISDKKASNYLITIMTIVNDCVNEVFQTYVDDIKEQGKFDKEAQEHALQMCLEKITSQLGPDIMAYIIKNFGDITSYLTTIIESVIHSTKTK